MSHDDYEIPEITWLTHFLCQKLQIWNISLHGIERSNISWTLWLFWSILELQFWVSFQSLFGGMCNYHIISGYTLTLLCVHSKHSYKWWYTLTFSKIKLPSWNISLSVQFTVTASRVTRSSVVSASRLKSYRSDIMNASTGVFYNKSICPIMYVPVCSNSLGFNSAPGLVSYTWLVRVVCRPSLSSRFND